MDTQGYEGCVLAGARRWLDAGTPLVMEFDPYLMKRVNSFGLMKAAIANYVGFHDLWRNPNRFRPTSDLDDLYAELDKERVWGDWIYECFSNWPPHARSAFMGKTSECLAQSTPALRRCSGIFCAVAIQFGMFAGHRFA